MKPTFALDFRDGQVTLLHRTSRGWTLVGSAAFGAPDFDETLAYLRSTAMGLSPRGITTKLILPNKQILYTDVDVGGSDGSRRRRLIRLALEGRTPYPVDDLVWDWSGDGTTVKVAVIARETLTEAEAFAVTHRFNPVSFVSVPEEGEFDGEPFFGPTAHAPQVLGEADKVERDAEPVQVVLREAAKPEAGPAITEADLAPPVQDARDIEAEAEAAEVAAEVAALAEVAAQAEAPRAAETLATANPFGEELPVWVAEPAPETAADAKAEPLPTDSVAPDAVAEAPMALDVMADPFVEDDVPPAPAAAIAAAFAARRGNDATKKVPDRAGFDKSASDKVAAEKTAEKAVEKAASDKAAADNAAADRAEAEKAEARSIGGVSRPGAARPALAKAPAKSEPLAFPSKTAKVVKGKSAGVTSTSIPGIPRREKNVVTLPTSATSESGEAAKPARPNQVFKGRTPIGGKPPYLGLILTVALLLLLAGIAVWSSFFMGTGEAVEPTSGTPQEGSAASLDAPATDGAAENTAAANDPVAGAVSTGTAPEATTATEAAALPDAATPVVAETAIPVAAAAPDTTVATLTAPKPGPAVTQETAGIRLATADTPPGVAVPQALGPLTAGVDSQPAAPPEPPPFGTVYKFDENGRITPTPEGIMTPEGVLLIAGKPAKVPPQRPAELTVVTAPVAAALPTAEQTTAGQTTAGQTTATQATAEQTTAGQSPGVAVPATGALPAALEPTPEPNPEPAPIADPTLQGKRPVLRPAGLTAPDQQGATEPAQTLPAAAPPSAEDLRLAALRPSARPEGLVVPAPDAAAAPQNNASLMASGAPLLTAPVTRAPRPPAKPTDLNRAVDDAVTAALDQPAAQDAAPQEEPEPDDKAPSLPTNASVAKQATTKDALNTKKMALLAVFGTASNRFAMVRQPNGAVKKVRVGDRIDGGNIAAITENSVQYQKGGRMVTLALPTG